jgi:hypothetical protein
MPGRSKVGGAQIYVRLNPRESQPSNISAPANTHPLSKGVIVDVRRRVASTTLIPKKRNPAVFPFMEPILYQCRPIVSPAS